MPRGKRLLATIGIPEHPDTHDVRFFATYLPGGDANAPERMVGPYRSVAAANEEAMALCPMGTIRVWKVAISMVE